MRSVVEDTWTGGVIDVARWSCKGCFPAPKFNRFSVTVNTVSIDSIGAFWSSLHVSLVLPIHLVLLNVRRQPSTLYRSSSMIPFVLTSHWRSQSFCHWDSSVKGSIEVSSFRSLWASRAFTLTNKWTFSFPTRITFVKLLIKMQTCVNEQKSVDNEIVQFFFVTTIDNLKVCLHFENRPSSSAYSSSCSISNDSNRDA